MTTSPPPRPITPGTEQPPPSGHAKSGSSRAASGGVARKTLQRAGHKRKPSGLHVVVLGPDGAGKSTAIAGMSGLLSNHFRQVFTHHWAPRLFRPGGDGAPVPEPHAAEPRSGPASLIKLAYLWFDFTFGHLTKVRIPVARSNLVIFDRYFQDLLVDSRRYRYGGPMWLAGLVGRVIPKPDLIILLDAPSAVIQGRVSEVSFEETSRQRKAYRDLVEALPNGRIVNADQSPGVVVEDMTRTVLDFLGQSAGRTVEVLS